MGGSVSIFLIEIRAGLNFSCSDGVCCEIHSNIASIITILHLLFFYAVQSNKYLPASLLNWNHRSMVASWFKGSRACSAGSFLGVICFGVLKVFNFVSS